MPVCHLLEFKSLAFIYIYILGPQQLQLRLSILYILRGVEGNFGAHFGLKCSSLCKMNIGTSFRSACTSIGYEGYKSVCQANMLLERTQLRLSKINIYVCIIYYRIRIVWPIVIDSGLSKVITNKCFQSSPARTCLMALLCTCQGGVWSLEQPSGSLAEYYPAFRVMLEAMFRCGGDYAVRILAWHSHWSSLFLFVET